MASALTRGDPADDPERQDATWNDCGVRREPPPATFPPGGPARVAIALPADQPDEAEAVALGALLGGYAFRKYRTSAAEVGDVEQIVYTAQEAAVSRARILAEAMALVRDLVNTAPADLVPADLAAAAERVAAAQRPRRAGPRRG